MEQENPKVSAVRCAAISLLIFAGLLPNPFAAMVGVFALLGAGEDYNKWDGWKVAVRVLYILTLIQQIILIVLLAILITVFFFIWVISISVYAGNVFFVLSLYIFPFINVQLCLACKVYSKYIGLFPDPDDQKVVPAPVYAPGQPTGGQQPFYPGYPQGTYPAQGQQFDPRMYPPGAFPGPPNYAQGAYPPTGTVPYLQGGIPPQELGAAPAQPSASNPNSMKKKASLTGPPAVAESDTKRMVQPSGVPAGTASHPT